MRFATMAIAVVSILAILGAAAAVYVMSDEARDARQNIEDAYDIDGYRKALEDEGLYPGDTPRILPGSLGSCIEYDDGVSQVPDVESCAIFDDSFVTL